MRPGECRQAGPMSRSAEVPDELRFAPFTTATAAAAGLSRKQLRSGAWRHVLRYVYAHVDLPDSVATRAAAIALVLPPYAVVGYTAAAWLHGADVRRLS